MKLQHFLLILGVGLLLAGCAQPANEGNSATVMETVNQVEAHSRLDDTWQPAKNGMTIYGGGQVRTGVDSSAQVALMEGIVRLWAETMFTVRDNQSREGRLMTTLYLESGRLWANLTTPAPHEFTVETASAAVTVRDTRFSVAVQPNRTTLVSVAEGEAVVTALEQSVIVPTGQQTRIEPGRPPAPPEPMTDAELSLWATAGDAPELVQLISTPTPTRTPSPTNSPVPAATLPSSETATPVSSATPLPTATPPPTVTPTTTPTGTPTASPSPTASPTGTPSPTSVPLPQHISLTAEDGQALTGIQYPAAICPALITVGYFPWVRGDAQDWNTLAALLPDAPPYEVVSLTARGCEGGCSETWDRAGWRLDYPAALRAAGDLPCAGTTMVTIGSSVGADGAIYACGLDDACVGALAFSPNGYLDIPLNDEVATLINQGKSVWVVLAQDDAGSARLDQLQGSPYFRQIVLPGAGHGNQLYHPASAQLIHEFMGCAKDNFTGSDCATATISLTPGPPEIVAIDFPAQVPADGSTSAGTVTFRDPDGDLNRVTFEVVEAGSFNGFELQPVSSLMSGNVTSGVFRFSIRCGTPQQVRLRATLYDTAGNSTTPTEFGFTCQ